jgi:hypothetical protein
MPKPDGDNQDPTGGTPPAEPDDGGKKNGEPKTFTQEQIDAIAAKTREEAKASAQKDYEKKLAADKAEWERQAKLSEDERRSESEKQRLADIERRENEVKLGSRRIEVHKQLAEKDLPTSFVDLVADIDEEKTKSNIENLEKDWNETVDKAVEEKLKLAGVTPDAKGDQGKKQKPQSGTRVL